MVPPQGTMGKNKIAYTAKDPCPPTVFTVPKRKKSWWCGEGEEEEEG